MMDLFEKLSPERDVDLVVLTSGYLLPRGTPPARVFPALHRSARVERGEGVFGGKNV
jgi:hypothetical protein